MEKLLKQFGFSDPEVVVYKALLRLGSAKVSEIARAAGQKRTSCQENIRSIEEKGFINSTKVGNKYFYQTEDPDRFRQIMSEREYIVDRLIPDLRNQKKPEIWEARSLSREEAELIVRRAKRKEQEVTMFGEGEVKGLLVNNETIALISTNDEIPAVEIRSKVLAGFHKELLRSKTKKTR